MFIWVNNVLSVMGEKRKYWQNLKTFTGHYSHSLSHYFWMEIYYNNHITYYSVLKYGIKILELWWHPIMYYFYWRLQRTLSSKLKAWALKKKSERPPNLSGNLNFSPMMKICPCKVIQGKYWMLKAPITFSHRIVLRTIWLMV